jgi:hypothetical protein
MVEIEVSIASGNKKKSNGKQQSGREQGAGSSEG